MSIYLFLIWELTVNKPFSNRLFELVINGLNLVSMHLCVCVCVRCECYFYFWDR